VTFEFRVTKDGQFQLETITPLAAAEKHGRQP
jgi:hypothetical protein